MQKRLFYLACVAYALVAMMVIEQGMRSDLSVDPAIPAAQSVPSAPVTDARAWFDQMKPFCNAVEVDIRVSARPAPAGYGGQGYEAACYAIAGKIGRADEIIMELSGDDRWRATGIVFDVAHPIADAGDDVASGPVMELVVKHWPNHYMALYHSGAARYQRSDFGEAREYLESFLQNYAVEDGWRANALTMLEGISKASR